MDQPATHRQQIDSLERERMAGRLDSSQRARPREGPSQAPLHRAAIVLGGRAEQLETHIWHRAKQFADEVAHALRRGHVHLTAHVLAPPVGPHRDGRVEVMCV